MECGSEFMTVSPSKKKPVYAALSITHQAVELVVFSPKNLSIEQSFSIGLPAGVIDPDLDLVADSATLKEALKQLFKSARPKVSEVHLSVPATLLRLVEMPKSLDAAGLYLSLSSEAERYKAFDNTEAVVDFFIVNNSQLPSNMQQLMLGAIRSDVLATYQQCFKEARVKIHSVGLEPLNVLRGMAGTGVLDSLVQQVGTDAHWGMILADPTHVRFSLWQCDQLLEFRELAMDTRNFATGASDTMLVEDLLEEIRRTTKTLQPVLWMTQNIPAPLCDALSGHLECPVRSVPLGTAINMTQPVSLAGIGAAMSSVVPFPFDLNILEGTRSLSSPTAGSSKMASGGLETSGGGPSWLIPAGLASVVLGGLLSAALWLLAVSVASQVPGVQSKVDGLKVEVSGLQSRQAELKRKAELDQTLIQILQTAKIRNFVYVALADDLKRKTPAQIWIQSLEVKDGLTLTGKALNHKAVIQFAKSFDAAPYTKAVLIDSIMEGTLGPNLVYDFKISGGVNLDKSLLPSAPPPPASAPEAKPNISGA